MSARLIARRGFMVLGTLFCLSGFWALNAFRLNINASTSMPDNAYLMWTWPKLVWRGAVIAALPPHAYADRFEGLYFTKRVLGMPGDRISHVDGAVCVNGTCHPPVMRGDAPFAPPLPEGVIPPGMYAAFGISPDSLDSRYATIGLFPRDRIVAVGFGTNLVPNWKDLKAWADGQDY